MRFRTLVMAVAAALIAIAGAPATHAADDNLLQTIKDRGTMRVCDVGYAPWNVKNPATDQWEGVNVDLLGKVADLLK